MRNVINAQKDDVFRIRMNSEIKNELEEVFAKNGLTLTDAVNVSYKDFEPQKSVAKDYT